MTSYNSAPTRAQLLSGISMWYRETIAASQASNALNIFAGSSASTFRWIAPYAGKVIGVMVGADANMTAGALDIECFINNAEAGQISYSGAVTMPRTDNFTTPLSFTAGQTVDFRYTTDAGIAPLLNLQVIPILIFD